VPRKGKKKPERGREQETERARLNFQDDFEGVGQERKPGYGGSRKAALSAGE